jgi:hypothetical protein
MNSGVAKGIREHFPGAFTAYRLAYETSGLVLGTVVWAEDRGKVIGNCITQQDYGREPGRRYVDYDAVRACVREVNRVVGPVPVALPLIGAGLAQGDWGVIAAIIEEEAIFQPVVYVPAGRLPCGSALPAGA